MDLLEHWRNHRQPRKGHHHRQSGCCRALDRAAGWVGTISPPGVTGMMEEDSRAVFQGGNAAFMRNWPYAYSLGQGEDSPVAGMIDVTSLPGIEAGLSAATLGGWQLAVSKYSENPEAAAKLALWLASEESQKERALNISLLPTIPALYSDPQIAEAVPFMPNLLPVFTNAVARPSTASAPSTMRSPPSSSPMSLTCSTARRVAKMQ